MQRIIEYILAFVVLILSQVFIFDNINIWGYVNPYVYIMFIVMLPMEMRHTLLVFLGFVCGATIDLLTSSAGLSAMAATFIAFMRPSILRITAGRDVVNVGGIPSAVIMGVMHFWMYVLLMVVLYNVPYFSLEIMTLSDITHTILRIVFSSLFTTIVIYALHTFVTGKRTK